MEKTTYVFLFFFSGNFENLHFLHGSLPSLFFLSNHSCVVLNFFPQSQHVTSIFFVSIYFVFNWFIINIRALVRKVVII
jgi:hypothetical protein